MKQPLEVQFTPPELARFILELYTQGLRYDFTDLGNSTYRFVITGYCP